MYQDDELDESNDGHDSLSLVDIKELIKQEKCEVEELPSDDDLHKIVEEQFERQAGNVPSGSKKSGNVKRSRLQKPSKMAMKTATKSTTSTERMSNRELLTEMIKNELMETPEVRPVHTCKFCNRTFSSAFILCLHVQIHEKVNRVSKMYEENKTETADSSASGSQVEDDGRNKNSSDEIEISETKNVGVLPTSSPTNVGTSNASPLPAVISPENVPAKSGNSSSTSCNAKIRNKGENCGSPAKIKTETIEVDESVSIKNESISFVKNNFVEKLKRNLSLAMNKKL